MPTVELVAYREADGRVPLLEWFDELAPKARAKCVVRLERRAELGHELRRPEADYLRDDIYELRVKHQNVNLRMLYFFHRRTAVVVSHGFWKQQAKVPQRELDLAVRRRRAFEASPENHTYPGRLG